MTSWSEEWFTNTVEALGQIKGFGRMTDAGVAVPLISGLDTIAVLGIVGKGVKQAVVKFEQDAGASGNNVVASSELDDDGNLNGQTSKTISVDDYLAGYGLPWPNSYKRAVGKVDDDSGAINISFDETYEVFNQADLTIGILNPSQGSDRLMFARQLMNDWQRCVDASSACVTSTGVNSAATSTDETLIVFWQNIQALCADLDALQAVPPVTSMDVIKENTQAALAATEKFAGETVATLANETGKAAGEVAKGFFGQVGMLGIAVAGIAVYLLVR